MTGKEQEQPARLYLDHNVPVRLVEDLRRQSVDVVHALELGMQAAGDEAQLRRTAGEGRTLLTFDLDDFPVLASRWFERGEDHAGIVLCVSPPRIAYGELRRRLLSLLKSSVADDLRNQVLWLDASW